MYRTGELDQRVTFQRETLTPDGAGGHSSEWVDIGTRWALVRPMSGNERLAQDRVNATANYLIVIRNWDELTEKDVAVWMGRKCNIRFVKSRGPRSAFLEIEAEMGAAI